MDDIIFENRNRAYGAYQLRKAIPRDLKTGLLVAISLTLLLSVYSIPKTSELPADKIIEVIAKPKIIASREIDPTLEVLPAEQEQAHRQTAQRQNLERQAVTDYLVRDTSSDTNLQNAQDQRAAGLQNTNGEAGIIDGAGESSDNDAGSGATRLQKSPIKTFAEVMPEFIGGPEKMYDWLNARINYPEYAKETNTEGTVYASFIVNADGHVSDVAILKGIGFGCDEEVVRVLSSMPAWDPGKQGGTAVPVRMTIPVTFKLQGN